MLFSVKSVTPSDFREWASTQVAEEHPPGIRFGRSEHRPELLSQPNRVRPGQLPGGTGGPRASVPLLYGKGGSMTLLAERPGIIGPDEPDHPGAEDFHHPHEEGPTGILKWLTSTDHKVIGKSYMITSLILFFIAGLMAMVIRGQLMQPSGLGISFQTYNQLFTMHGSLMMYLFAGPFAFGGLANFILPLQVGAPDMAFPRLNALSYWLYLSGVITMLSGFLVAGGAASFGWVSYAPLSNATNSPGAGSDLWLMALALTGFSAIFTGVNLAATVFYLRAPGMTMFRIPIFSWNMLVTGILILIAFPVLFGAVVMLFCDRHFGTHIFTVSGGGSPPCSGNTSSGSSGTRRCTSLPCPTSAS